MDWLARTGGGTGGCGVGRVERRARDGEMMDRSRGSGQAMTVPKGEKDSAVSGSGMMVMGVGDVVGRCGRCGGGDGGGGIVAVEMDLLRAERPDKRDGLSVAWWSDLPS